MTDHLDELRHEIAAIHGLNEDAIQFLTGETLTGIEASALALVKLGARREPQPPTGPFTPGPEKAARQRQLLAALHGHPAPERDERGRYTASTRAGFDGGARTPVPARRNPEADHNALLAQLTQVSRTFRHDP